MTKRDFIKAKNFILLFRDSNLLHYASSLSFHTVLAFIPILLISLSVFTQMQSFEQYYDSIKQFIFSSMLPSHQDVITKYIDEFLINSGSSGMIGVIFVLYVSIMFFIDYESVVSKIFGSETRSIWESLSTYWTLITLTPVGIGISFYISNEIQNFLNATPFLSWINVLFVVPFLIIWLLFFIIYKISANIKIELKDAILTSFTVALTWYLSKTLFIYYVMYNKTYMSIYGSFSIIMFFFIWIYLSWIIFIYGLKFLSILSCKDDKKGNI